MGPGWGAGSRIVGQRILRRSPSGAERHYDVPMPLLGITLTLAGEERLAARPPQLGLSDVQSRELEPGRPVRFLDARGATLATGVADPENELVRVWSHGEDSRAPDAAFLRGKLGAALAHRRTLGLCDGASSYRLVNGEGDGLSGLTVDVYGPFAVVNALSRGLLGHARLLAQCALEMLPAADLPLRGAVLKARLKGSGNTPERAKDDVVGETPPDKLTVHESGVPYEVHLRGGINVGLFTDMREHRAGLGRFVRGKRVLNTFAYTGALSVAAARAGAAAITSVDSGRRSSRLGPRQLRALRTGSGRAPLGSLRRLSLPRGRARPPRGLRRHHPRPTDSVGRARLALGSKARLPGPHRRRLRPAPGRGRPPLGLLEHPPGPQRPQACRRRPRPRQARRPDSRARRPPARLPDAGQLAFRALPRGLPESGWVPRPDGFLGCRHTPTDW